MQLSNMLLYIPEFSLSVLVNPAVVPLYFFCQGKNSTYSKHIHVGNLTLVHMNATLREI